VKIARLELRLLQLPLLRPFETSFGRVDRKEFILVRVDDEGAVGYGECIADRDPYYSPETTKTVWDVISEFIAPRVVGAELAHPGDLSDRLTAIRGHRMAKAAVEMAAWDLFARQQGQPLGRVLGGSRDRIVSGVSIGIQESLAALMSSVERELAAGYRRIKIKIKPGWDLDAVEAIRRRFGSIPLMVDANGAYTLSDAAHLGRLDACDLMMIEQPLEYDDIPAHACLQRQITTPVCLDESIESVKDAEQAIDLGACRVINIKPGRVGGFRESVRIHNLCAERGIPVWHGGMLESGIGRAANVHLSSLPNFSIPGDVSGSNRYFDADLIEPPIEVASDGSIAVPTGPGLGVSIVESRLEGATRRRLTLGRPSAAVSFP
jgi:o-succinylbenzoate synthase